MVNQTTWTHEWSIKNMQNLGLTQSKNWNTGEKFLNVSAKEFLSKFRRISETLVLIELKESSNICSYQLYGATFVLKGLCSQKRNKSIPPLFQE